MPAGHVFVPRQVLCKMRFDRRPDIVAEAFSWIPRKPAGRAFINLSQAVPGYPPAAPEVVQRLIESRARARIVAV
jgi:hypothetical protein